MSGRACDVWVSRSNKPLRVCLRSTVASTMLRRGAACPRRSTHITKSNSRLHKRNSKHKNTYAQIWESRISNKILGITEANELL